MEYEQVKEWLDNHVEDIEKRKEHQYCGNQIRTFKPDNYIFVDKGIDIVADIMGIELVETYEEDSKYPYKYSFVYRDIRFIQIEKERLESFANAGTD